MKQAPDALRKGVERLREAISELEGHFSSWSSENAQDGRKLRSLAKRISLAAKNVEQLVSENTYHTGGV